MEVHEGFTVLGQLTQITLARDKKLFSPALWRAEGSEAALLVSGRCLHATASLREPTKDIRNLLKIHKNFMIKGDATKLFNMRTFLHAKIYRILTE